MQTQESNVVSSKAMDVDLVVMECSGTEYGKQDTISNSGNCLTHVVDADIRPVDNQVLLAKNLVGIDPALAPSQSALFPYSHNTPFFNHTKDFYSIYGSVHRKIPPALAGSWNEYT
nr:hypothetical protein [Tanacetum cinerariifolium]